MNLRNTVVPFAISLLLAQAAFAQAGRKPDLMPEAVMAAEFPSLDDAAPIRLSAYRNRVVVLALWASWCPACWAALKSLNDHYARFSRNGVEVIGLTVEDPLSAEQSVRSFMRTYEIKFKVGWINEETAKTLIEESIPGIFVIAGDGRVVRKFTGWHPSKSPRLLRRAVRRARLKPRVAQ